MVGLYVVGVCYTEDGAEISDVRVRFLIKGNDGELRLKQESVWSVDVIRGVLRAGELEVRTATFNSATKMWVEGAAVGLYGDSHITTDPDDSKKNNLGELPEFF